ncbi:MAG: bifunctional [glutamine synthetase] adenylyltransferase/[glutamine synthetase]-adenylyl-L-tyrosine phosphorylase, partial [Actinobacteria bacterium]|nr:bifunctional [glutamine synthetase] adenylyltransferase/[glutamine synthetase]-adenylyl-L-tyrosine phosphorylase [Actinomycetota bacterium]
PAIARGPQAEDSLSLRLHATLVDIVGDDLTGRLPLAEAKRKYSEAVDRLVEETLERAREELAPRHPGVSALPFAVVAMGKWGANELNYYSDLDLVFVHDTAEAGDGDRQAAQALASRVMALLSSPTFDGPVFNVDADLRPEGSMGPLSRSLPGYQGYYRRWSEAWELQALLKARPAAGDPDLGSRFRALADEIIWEEGLDHDALRSVRQLKGRAESEAPPGDLKRSRGGIRDIEFTVQLMQLVHGRFDPELRVTATLDAIAALGDHGYIDADDQKRLADDYRFLREAEHRLQIWDLHQTHRVPDSATDRERLGRLLGFTTDPAAELEAKLSSVRGEVRDLHERLYFRPILDSLAGVGSARLDPTEAAVRLEALGFRDLVAATRTFEELTSGLSRRSRLMHQALPLMIDWLSLSPDPDLGLAQLRLLLAHTPDHSNLVTLLQNNPLAGERLCLLLGTGRLVGDLIDRIPEFIPRLADDTRVTDVRDGAGATERLIGLLDSRDDPEGRIGTIRRFVRRRKLRIAGRDILGDATVEETLGSLTDSADAAMAGAFHIMPEPPHQLAVIAMGKWGGRELSYGSDLDLMYVYPGDGDRDHAHRLASELRRILSEPSRHGKAFDLDADLRPEGKKGPLVRSLDSYRRYYEEWVEPWELLALVKARPAAGDPDTLQGFSRLLEEVVWKDRFPESMVREIRKIKARVESERIPPGEDPDFHLKLGPGGLTDVEFATQLLQLRHGGARPHLRVQGTLLALRRLHEDGLLGRDDFDALTASYLFCTRARLRLHLQEGSVTDSLPTDSAAASRLAASLGFERTGELREEYRRHTRRARRSFERIFYG